MSNVDNECGIEIVMSEDVNPSPQTCTVCTGDTTNNIFYVNGKCKLDEMTFEQVYLVLQKIPIAKKDLEKITSDEVLLQLARDTRPIQDEIESDKQASDLINKKGTLLYYDLKGNIYGDII